MVINAPKPIVFNLLRLKIPDSFFNLSILFCVDKSSLSLISLVTKSSNLLLPTDLNKICSARRNLRLPVGRQACSCFSEVQFTNICLNVSIIEKLLYKFYTKLPYVYLSKFRVLIFD